MFSPRAIRSISSLNHLFYSIPSPALGNRYPPPHPYLPQLQACRPIEHMLLSHTTYVAPELAPKHIADNIMKCSPKQSKPAATSGSPVRFQRTPKNTKAILKEAGSGLDRVVKVVVYVKDSSIMSDFASVYDPAFPHRPARSMVEVSKLPAGVNIQVDFIAVV